MKEYTVTYTLSETSFIVEAANLASAKKVANQQKRRHGYKGRAIVRLFRGYRS